MTSKWMKRTCVVFVLAFATPGFSMVTPDVEIGVDTIVAGGFSLPLLVTHAGDGSGRLFVVEQGGLIWIIDDGTVLPTPFLDLRGIVLASGERGLLGLAFHPDYANNGLFYVCYTNVVGTSVIARYAVSPTDGNLANPASAQALLAAPQPFANHNGGHLAFGPNDGFLYIALGDGGSGNDPLDHGQNINTLLGSILRIDVDGGAPYNVPANNPFVGMAGADEIWAYGLRNPWRFSFDRANGDLYIGDVGQGAWEEIDFQVDGTVGGLNFGWKVREGPCLLGQTGPCTPAPPPYVDPIAFYGRSSGRSVTGGYVYRGSRFPALTGRYFYGDFVSGRIFSVYRLDGEWSTPEIELESGFNISSFGEDEQGEIYVVDYVGGNIRRLEDAIDQLRFLSTTLADGFFDEPYSKSVPVVGGVPPYLFELVSGSLAPGLSGPDPATGLVKGTPTALGTFGPFGVRVTDSEGRFSEADFTHRIRLAAPELIAPSGASPNVMPTFSWQASPGATSYDLLVQNVTDDLVALDVAGIPDTKPVTSYLPVAPLASGKLYAWRARAANGAELSDFSPDLEFEIDTTPPGVTSLQVTRLAGFAETSVTAVDSSGDLAAIVGRDKATDGDLVSHWSSPGRFSPQNEHLTVDLGSAKTVGRVRLGSRHNTSLTFPVDFQIQASVDGSSFSTVTTVSDFVATANTLQPFAFTPVTARYVRVLVTKVRQYTDGAFYVQLAEIEVDLATAVPNALLVSWNAPGDDGSLGTAADYDLRWSPSEITEASFSSAEVVPETLVPLPAGSPEQFLFTGLAQETTYHLAIRTIDDAGNVSALSDDSAGVTLGVAPAPVTDLAADNPQVASIDLTWTATGDDALAGTAFAYDVRISTAELTEENFDGALQVTEGVPMPSPAGTAEAMTVGGRTSNTTYYVGIRVLDEVGNESSVSNVVVAATLDDIAPAAVTDLAAAVAFSYTPLVVTALGSSGDLAASVSKEKATDGNVVTFWSSVGRLIPQEEYLTVDTGSVRMLGRVHLTSRNVANLFPEDFDIQISTDDVSYVTVASETGFVSTPGTPYTFVFSPATARYVKLRVTKARQYVDGTYYVQVAEMSVDEVTSQADQVTLGWTSPGDDGTVGTASSYELRYSTSPINAGNFPSAMLVAGVSAPQVAGSAETHVLTGLSAETLYYFALKTKDEAPNESGLSNVSQVQTVPVPPAAVSDLAASGATTSSVDLDWTATGDDGLVGQATSYEVRYSTSPLTDENFGSATLVVSGVPSPSPSGQAESMTVGSLSASMPYYFGLKVHDDASGVSLLSNVVMKETLDNIVPSTVTDLSGGMGGSLVKPVLVATASSGDLAASVSKEKAVDGSATTFWSSVGTSTPQVEFLTVDTGSVRDLRQVDLIARNVANLFPEDFEVQVSENGVDYTTVVSETGHVAAPGSRSSFVFSSVFGRYVRLRVTKARQYVDGGYYVQFAELEVYEFQSQSGSVLLSWTAPGDDGSVGQATSYDVRYSQSLITAGNFGSAPEAVGEPSPSVAGSAESFLVTGLSAETGYYFALKTTDDSTNTSGISNVVLSYTPGTPPSSVTDLVASNPTNTTVDLDWTSTGDDGLVGTASSYELRYSTSPVTAGNFSGAMLVGSPPVPSVSGSPETKTVGGLTPGETYYFALKVVDEAGNKSGLSNVVTGTTVDDIAPSTVTDLGLSLGSVILQNVPSVGVGASGELLPVTNVTDGSLITIWSSLGSAVQREEFVTVDMGGMHLLGRVRLRSRTVAPELFPEDVVVEVSADNVSFTPVHTATGLGIQASTWFTLDMGTPTLGRYVRIRVTKMRPYAPDNRFYAQIAEVETLESVTSVNVSWTAPGDDGSVGTASSYDLRYSTSPITAGNFAAATPVAGVPAPSVAGSAEAHTVGVLGGSTHYFALKSTDDQGNVSNLSNVTSLVP